MTSNDADMRTRELAAESVASGDPTGWFEHLYADAEQGRAIVPWDRGAAHPRLAEWALAKHLDGHGQSAVIVGCGLGDDAEFIAGFGYQTTAFDISESGIRSANQRFPDTRVRYKTANLLNLPEAWRGAFDLVVEVFTVQALPEALHPKATRAVCSLVAFSGTLIVVAAARNEDGGQIQGPPWPLTRREIEAFGGSGSGSGLDVVKIERIPTDADPEDSRWRAEYRRTAR